MVELIPLSSGKETNMMMGHYNDRPIGNHTTRYLKRYTVSYVWDDGELTGVEVTNNLSYNEAKSFMRDLESMYPHFIKKAVMAEMVEVIV